MSKQPSPADNASNIIASLTSGTLDGRSKFSCAISQIREIAKTEPEAVTRGLLVDSLAVWACVQSAILSDISRVKDVLSEERKLLPLFDELERTQKNILTLHNGIVTTDRLSDKRKPSTRKAEQKRDISALFEV